MSDLIIKKNGTDYELPMLAEHYPADRVYLDGDISKTVQDEIRNHSFGTRVNITSYTSSANKYTCPSDGYIRFEGTGGVSLELNDVTMFQNTNLRTSIYVRKDMTVWFSSGTLSLAEFIPLV